jgi:hypothetical protein
MDKNLRAENLDFIRWMFGGHVYTAKLLQSAISNEALLSQLALGKKPISDSVARSVEHILELPTGWLDRDNIGHIKSINQIDFDITNYFKDLPCDSKDGLHKFLKNIA